MAAKKVGDLIKEARTNAGLSQTALAAQIDGLSASDIGKAERGEKELTQAQLKAIAKITGVTQKSLLEAPKGASTTTSTKKTASSATTTKKATPSASKKTTASSTSTKKAASSASKKTTSASKTTEELKLSAAEKTLIKLYRAADTDTKKAAVSLLKGEEPEPGDLLSSLLDGAMDMLSNLGKK